MQTFSGTGTVRFGKSESSKPKTGSSYSKKDYDNARAAGFGHDDAVARAKSAAKQRAKFRSQGNKAQGRSFEEITSGTWEREKKRRAKAAEGWLSGNRGQGKR